MFFLGFDIGGSSVKAVLVEDKKIIKSAVEDLPASFEELLDLIVKIVSRLSLSVKSDKIGGIGLGIAGTLDLGREKMLNSPNIPYLNNQPIKKLLAEKLKPHRIKLEHDVHCFLLAEKEKGEAKNFKNIFCLTLGTGIGGAWMVDGKIFFGAHGAAGEAGHMVMEMPQGLDWEELASNKFIEKSLGLGSLEANKLAKQGDNRSQEVLGRLGRNLGVGLANIINIFDPEAIILGGGLAQTEQFILAGIQEGISRYVISPAAKETKILFSRLGREAGALGATLLFEKNYKIQ